MKTIVNLLLAGFLLSACGSTLGLGEAGTSLSGHGTIRFVDPVTDTVREAEGSFSVVLMTAPDLEEPGESHIIHCAVITESPVGSGAVEPPFSHPQCMKEAGGPYYPFRFQLVIPAPVTDAPASPSEEPVGVGSSSAGDDSEGGDEAPTVPSPVTPDESDSTDGSEPATVEDTEPETADGE